MAWPWYLGKGSLKVIKMANSIVQTMSRIASFIPRQHLTTQSDDRNIAIAYVWYWKLEWWGLERQRRKCGMQPFLKSSELWPSCFHKNLRGVYSDTTQLNSTDPVEQRTANSVVFLFMTSQPTNWVNCCSRCRVEFSWVELCRNIPLVSHSARTNNQNDHFITTFVTNHYICNKCNNQRRIMA